MTSPAETEQTFLIGHEWAGLYRDRYAYARDTLIEEAVSSWRLNPLARRLANLYKIYNVDGIAFQCEHAVTKKFLDGFWSHPLNKMKKKLEKISNEVFLTGNLFTLFSVDAMGMTYVRIYPTDQIERIVSAPNDLEQETSYFTRPVSMDAESVEFFNPYGRASAVTPQFMTHAAINQLAGTVWGEGEIWPDLPWLGRYASFLEDRVRLNRFRQAYMYDVLLSGKTDEQVRARKREILNDPPRSGSVNVHGADEVWSVINPQLSSNDAETDGLALKKMIAVNHVPMHYLSEPESSTRTTADAAGTPTFKAFENQQDTFIDLIHDILMVAVQRRAAKDDKVDATVEITVTSADATERDNAALALATGQIVTSIGDMFDRGLLDESEYLRLVYRFAGETLPNNFKAPKGKRKSLNSPANATPGGLETDVQTGDVKVQPK